MALLKSQNIQAEQAHYENEIRKCANGIKGYLYFLVTYLRIVTKDADVIPFRPKMAQQIAINDLTTRKRIFTLKARQLGYSTVVASWFFWNVMFHQNRKCAVVAHTEESAKEIFSIYQNYYRYLPDWMKALIPTVSANTNELAFAHGSKIKVMSRSTRGGSYQMLHASEFAFYNNITATMASVMQMVGKGGQIILETTSNGQNEAYDLWTGQSSYGGKGVWKKRFIWWGMEPEYSDKPLKKSKLTQEEIDYAKMVYRDVKVVLTLGQLAWVRHKVEEFGGSWAQFNREYPATDELAFIATGKKFFYRHYANVRIPEDYAAYQEYEAPDRYAKYLMGVDTAAGNPEKNSDFSAFTIWKMVKDGKKEKSFVQVASFKDRVPISEFSEIAYSAAMRYEAFTTIESNSYGLTVLDHFIMLGYPWLYKRTELDKGRNRVQEVFGFVTSAKTRLNMLSGFQKRLDKGLVDVADPRLKREINGFEYKTALRPEANKDCKDDMVLATGLAFMGTDQCGDYEESKNFTVRPRTNREIALWEMKTGKIYDPSLTFADDFGRSLLEQPVDVATQDLKN